MKEDLPKILIISGPTCSGKSVLAVEVALRLGGEIINADSMQVYRGMDVGTAKLPRSERGEIPHHLLDIVYPDQEFNAALFLSHALPITEDLAQKGIPIIIVGGTGLYVKALLGGLFRCPPPKPQLRRELWEECENKGSLVLHERLSRLDRRAAEAIQPRDRIRIIRALEVVRLTGRPFSELAGMHQFSETRFHALHLCLHVETQALYARINRRTLSMIDSGLIGEVEGLLAMGYGPGLKPMKAIGYRHIIRYLEGGWDLDEAIRLIQRDTRRYAKRQITWFRADPSIVWMDPDDRSAIISSAMSFMQ